MPPQITTTVAETRQVLADVRRQGLTIGFVPTMGALHAGHASLMRAARRDTGLVVVSIFVNPAQFGPHEDLARYPRPFEQDVALCEAEGVDLIFRPEPAVMYPPGFRTWVEVEELQDRWEGASRPGHFRGVATVVLKLFNNVQPDVAYFGQKDAQQARLIEQMVRDLNVPVSIAVLPTVREADGLALSSRNQYLDEEQRRRATVLYRALEAVRQGVASGERDSAVLAKLVTDRVDKTPGARLDYVAFVNRESLEPLEKLHGDVVVLLAVHLGTTRLIDNIEINLA